MKEKIKYILLIPVLLTLGIIGILLYPIVFVLIKLNILQEHDTSELDKVIALMDFTKYCNELDLAREDAQKLWDTKYPQFEIKFI